MKKITSIIILVVFTAFLLTGCEEGAFSKVGDVFTQAHDVFGELSSLLFDKSIEVDVKQPEREQRYSLEYFNEGTEQRASAASEADLAAAVDSIDGLAAAFSEHSRDCFPKGNVIIAPLSGCGALASAYYGTKEDSDFYRYMLKGMDADSFNAATSRLIGSSNSDGLKINGSVFAFGSGVSPAQGCADDLKRLFGCDCVRLDFTDENSDKMLDSWLYDKENAPESVYSKRFYGSSIATVTAVTSYSARPGGVYDFRKCGTRKFSGGSGTKKLSFIEQVGSFGYAEGKTYTAVSVAMEDGAVLELFLPREGRDAADILASLTAELKYDERYLDVILPAFDVSSSRDIDDILDRLGIADHKQLGYNKALDPEKRMNVDAFAMTCRMTVEDGGDTGDPSYRDKAEAELCFDRPFAFRLCAKTKGGRVPIMQGAVRSL